MRNMLIVLVILLALPARAEVCPKDADGMAMGPVQAGFYDGDLALGRRACGRTEVGLALGAGLIAEPENFYGNIKALADIDGSYALDENLEIFGALEVVRYQTVISSFTDSALGLGHLSLGAGYALASAEDYRLLGHGRVVLPTASGLYQNMRPLGIDAGVSGAYVLRSDLRLHGSLLLPFSIGLSRAASRPRLGVDLAVGGAWQPLSWFAFALDINGQFAYAAPVDFIALRPGLRFAAGDALGIELGAAIPLAGRERNLAAVMLRAAWRI